MWTFILNEEWFKELSGIGRGLILQLIIMSKERQDNGRLVFRSWDDLGSQVAVSRHTCGKIAAQLTASGILSASKSESGRVAINLLKYMEWQELTAKQVAHKLKHPASNLTPTNRQLEKSIVEKSIKEDIPFSEIISDLNDKANKSLRTTSTKTRSLITARWREGFRLPDFIHVHEVKVREWLGTDMEKYLRPETLYGNKFEGYRQQKSIKAQDDICLPNGVPIL